MENTRRVAVMVRRLSGRGGMERVIRHVAEAAGRAEPKAEVEVWCFGVPPDAMWLEHLPHRIANIDQGTGRRFQLGTKLPLYTRAAARFIREWSPDVLLATDPVFVRAGLGARRSRTAPRVFSWLHFAVDRVANRQWLVPADGHLAISTQIGDAIREIGAIHPPVTVGNPLPDGNHRVLREPSGDPRLLFIGRLQNHQKRVDLLLTALRTLNAHPWHLDVVGDGPDRAMLEDQAKASGIQDRIVWHGWVEDPWRAVEAASVLVLPSDFEGFPMVLLEALAHGLPVVATDCDAGPRDIVLPDQNGWLVPPGDASALAEVLGRFVDRKRGSGLGWSALERQTDVQARFSERVVWDRMAEALFS